MDKDTRKRLGDLSEQTGEEGAARAALSDLRALLKDPFDRETADFLLPFLPAWEDRLKDPDPKTRKNAALLIGTFLAGRGEKEDEVSKEAGERLYAAYEGEETLFVRPAYLKAMSEALDMRPYEKDLSQRLEAIQEKTWEEGDLKHIREERKALEAILAGLGKGKAHAFQGLDRPYEMLLTCDPPVREMVKEALGQDARLAGGGVRAAVSSWGDLQRIRLYREALFLIPMKKGYVADERTIGTLPQNSRLLPILDSLFKGGEDDSYTFRLEIRSDREEDRLGAFLRKKAAEMEEASGGRLQNVPGAYEVTLVLIRTKAGTFAPFLRLNDGTDQRFSYRKDIEAASMPPVMAAETCALIRPCLRHRAKVLDPFCGVGTLLIERDRCVRAGEIYGTDIYGHAIPGARRNADRAGVTCQFINRDFFDFIPPFLFDEVITEFPDLYGKTMKERDDFYRKTFHKILMVTGEDGRFFLLSGEEGLVHKYIRLHPELSLIRTVDLRKRETIYIIQRKKV